MPTGQNGWEMWIFYKVPVKKLISDEYAKERMKDYDATKAGNSKEVLPGTITESEETTHLSVYDKEGNAVAVTTTLNGGYGSRDRGRRCRVFVE
jgi:gamma-glutamyltranspeptidase/glutathione hydrolase